MKHNPHSQSALAMEAARRIATIRRRKRKRELGHEVCRHLLDMLWDDQEKLSLSELHPGVGRRRGSDPGDHSGGDGQIRSLLNQGIAVDRGGAPATSKAEPETRQLALL